MTETLVALCGVLGAGGAIAVLVWELRLRAAQAERDQERERAEKAEWELLVKGDELERLGRVVGGCHDEIESLRAALPAGAVGHHLDTVTRMLRDAVGKAASGSVPLATSADRVRSDR